MRSILVNIRRSGEPGFAATRFLLHGGLPRIFLLVSLAALCAGLYYRFHALDRKLFWQDEAYTALRVTGHTERDYRRLFDGRMHPTDEVLSFERLDRRTDDTLPVRTLAKEDPHHAPLFYLIERYWIDVAGSSVTAFRLLPAILGALGIILAYLFGRQLFVSRMGGIILATLIASSPFFVIYSGQAREYALLIDATLLASLALLNARSSGSALAWTLYALTLDVGIYTDPLFTLTVAAHAIIVALLDRKHARVIRSFLAACIAAVAIFSPWIINALNQTQNISDQLSWGHTIYPASYFVQKWLFNVSALFFDYEFHDQRFIVLALALITFVFFACAFTARRSSAIVRSFALIVPVVTFAGFLLLDVFQGSHYSTIMRYLSSGWIGIECAVAATLLAGLSSGNDRVRAGALAGYIAILGCGIVSAAARDGIPNWWDNNDQIAYQDVAAVINEKQRPLIISEAHWHVPLVLAHYLRPDASYLLLHESGAVSLPPDLRNTFLVGPSPFMLARISAEARPALHLVNVSPPTTNLITRAHTALPRRSRAYESWETPNNALWAFVPDDS